MRVKELLTEGEERLEKEGIDTARLDAELLVGKVLGVTRLELYRDRDRALSGEELAAARELIERRARHEPAAYLLGEWGFRNLTLEVDRRVLIPRPGTETVVERCLDLLREIPEPEVLDIGTGSGAIALAIADEHPGARVTAIDSSEDALAVAALNLERTALGDRVTFVHRNLAESLGGPYDLVVSNPPYVTDEELVGLQPEIREWEPMVALVDRGQTEVIARASRDALRAGGWLVLEVGDARAEETGRLVRELGFQAVRATPDLTGRDRVVEGQWAQSKTP